MSKLFGEFHVTPIGSAIKDAQSLFPKFRDYQELRRHALKLAFWPDGKSVSGQVADMDWDEITGMAKPRANELRVDDEIGGYNNLRIIFYPFEKKIILPGDVLPRLWVISVMQKKTQRFSTNDFDTFSARIKIVRIRNYHDHL